MADLMSQFRGADPSGYGRAHDLIDLLTKPDLNAAATALGIDPGRLAREPALRQFIIQAQDTAALFRAQNYVSIDPYIRNGAGAIAVRGVKLTDGEESSPDRGTTYIGAYPLSSQTRALLLAAQIGRAGVSALADKPSDGFRWSDESLYLLAQQELSVTAFAKLAAQAKSMNLPPETVSLLASVAFHNSGGYSNGGPPSDDYVLSRMGEMFRSESGNLTRLFGSSENILSRLKEEGKITEAQFTELSGRLGAARAIATTQGLDLRVGLDGQRNDQGFLAEIESFVRTHTTDKTFTIARPSGDLTRIFTTSGSTQAFVRELQEVVASGDQQAIATWMAANAHKLEIRTSGADAGYDPRAHRASLEVVNNLASLFPAPRLEPDQAAGVVK